MENLNHEAIVNNLIHKIKSDFKISSDLSGKTNLLDLGLDSLDVMSYVFYIEDTYNISFIDDLLENEKFFIIEETANHIQANRA